MKEGKYVIVRTYSAGVFAGKDRPFSRRNEMDWIIGFLIGLAVMAPMFIKFWRVDSPRDKEDDKTLLGALD